MARKLTGAAKAAADRKAAKVAAEAKAKARSAAAHKAWATRRAQAA